MGNAITYSVTNFARYSQQEMSEQKKKHFRYVSVALVMLFSICSAKLKWWRNLSNLSGFLGNKMVTKMISDWCEWLEVISYKTFMRGDTTQNWVRFHTK